MSVNTTTLATLNTDDLTAQEAQDGMFLAAEVAAQKTAEEVIAGVNKASANETAIAQQADVNTTLADATEQVAIDLSQYETANNTRVSNAEAANAANAQAIENAGTAQEVVNRTIQSKNALKLGNVFGKKIMFVGDSTTAGSFGFSRIYGYMMGAGHIVRGDIGYNQGVGGDTTIDVLARIESIGAVDFDIADLQIGINDISVDTGTANEIFDRIKLIVNLLIGYGAEVVILHTVTQNDYDALATQYSAEQIQKLNDLNDLIRAYDIERVVIEGSAGENVLSTDFVDGRHYTVSGSIRLGLLQSAIFRDTQQRSYLSGFINDNMVTNPLLAGTTGSKAGNQNPTGEVATSWTGADPFIGGVTFSKTVGAISAGMEAQTMTLAPKDLSSGGVVIVLARQDVTVPTTVAEDRFLVMCRYKVEAGHEGIQNLEAKFGTLETIDENRKLGAIETGDEFEGYLVAVYSVDTTADLTSIRVEFSARFEAGPVQAVIHIDTPIVRKLA